MLLLTFTTGSVAHSALPPIETSHRNVSADTVIRAQMDFWGRNQHMRASLSGMARCRRLSTKAARFSSDDLDGIMAAGCAHAAVRTRPGEKSARAPTPDDFSRGSSGLAEGAAKKAWWTGTRGHIRRAEESERTLSTSARWVATPSL